MDTTGRTTLELTAVNLVDEFRDRELIASLPLKIVHCVLLANNSIDNLRLPFHCRLHQANYHHARRLRRVRHGMAAWQHRRQYRVEEGDIS